MRASPDDAQALRLLGRAFNRQGRYHDALGVASKSLKLHDKPETREEIAHAWVGLQRIPDAFDTLKSVVSELPRGAISPTRRTDGRPLDGGLADAEKGAILRSAFLALDNVPAAEACDRVLRAGEHAQGEYRAFEILPSLLEYCRKAGLPWHLAPKSGLIPMGKSVLARTSAQAYIGALPDGLIIGQSFIPASIDGFAFAEQFIHNPVRLVSWGRSISSDTVRAVGGARLLVQSHGLDCYKGESLLIGNIGNVGHWLLNNLARLWWLDHVPGLDQATIVIGSNAWDSQIECLSRMGVHQERVVRIPEGRIAQFERLWAPTMFYGAVGNQLCWWPGIVPFLRERLGMEFTSPRTHRIFLTRRTARWRRLLNEAEVLDELTRFGFEIVDPGSLSIGDQIALAGRAQMIAGEFGAGMMLMMFAAPGTPVVELKFDVANMMDIHPVIAREIGLPYFGVVGQARGDEPNPLNRDFAVAPSAVREAVTRALQYAGA